jgi:hypothetical protein
MPLNAFIVRPFGVKSVDIGDAELARTLAERHQAKTLGSLVTAVTGTGDPPVWKASINFDIVQELLLRPALAVLRVQGEAASAVVVAGNIREDMFNRLITADVVIADLRRSATSTPSSSAATSASTRSTSRPTATSNTTCSS